MGSWKIEEKQIKIVTNRTVLKNISSFNLFNHSLVFMRKQTILTFEKEILYNEIY